MTEAPLDDPVELTRQIEIPHHALSRFRRGRPVLQTASFALFDKIGSDAPRMT